MADFTIREYLPEDIPALTALWVSSFGDPERLVNEFFRILPGMGYGLAAVCGGKIAAGAYVITGMELVNKKTSVCGYIYAVAVDKKYRHLGLGGELVRRAAELARKKGAGIVCTLPAEKSLYKWYEDNAGLRCALFRRRETVISAAHEPCTRLSTEEYMRRREILLRGRAYMRPSAPVLEFTNALCTEYGGGLYACGSGIAAAYINGGKAVITELICPELICPGTAAASLGAFLGVSEAVCFLPSDSGEPFLSALPDSIPSDCIWGLALSEGEDIVE